MAGLAASGRRLAAAVGRRLDRRRRRPVRFPGHRQQHGRTCRRPGRHRNPHAARRPGPVGPDLRADTRHGPDREARLHRAPRPGRRTAAGPGRAVPRRQVPLARHRRRHLRAAPTRRTHPAPRRHPRLSRLDRPHPHHQHAHLVQHRARQPHPGRRGTCGRADTRDPGVPGARRRLGLVHRPTVPRRPEPLPRHRSPQPSARRQVWDCVPRPHRTRRHPPATRRRERPRTTPPRHWKPPQHRHSHGTHPANGAG